jgi:transcriptional regulator with XRE-family HTH domain
MPIKIGGKRKRKIFLAEHREAAGLTQEQLADRLGTTSMTVSRWERGAVLMNTDTLAAIAYALKGDLMEPEDLYHHPDKPSPNQLLRGQPLDIIDAAMKMIAAIRK